MFLYHYYLSRFQGAKINNKKKEKDKKKREKIKERGSGGVMEVYHKLN